jgi:hypothetical protein
MTTALLLVGLFIAGAAAAGLNLLILDASIRRLAGTGRKKPSSAALGLAAGAVARLAIAAVLLVLVGLSGRIERVAACAAGYAAAWFAGVCLGGRSSGHDPQP